MKRKKFKLRKGDEVIVLTGDSRGARGKVEKIDPKTLRVTLSDSNALSSSLRLRTFKKHVKPDANNPEGGIRETPRPIHISNIAAIDPKNSERGSRVGFRMDGETKMRYAKRSGSAL